jgi:hypothetical protein
MIPGGGYVAGWYHQGMQTAIKWVGEHWLGLEGKIIIQPTGSGDTMIEYVRALCYLAAALAGTLLWSIADRKRAAYPRLHMIFRTYVRLALAGVMLGYGLAKVFPMQFQVPGPDRLLQTYGNSSPMGLLWTFMGYSPAYTMFAGAMETIGALLLLFRRTATARRPVDRRRDAQRRDAQLLLRRAGKAVLHPPPHSGPDHRPAGPAAHHTGPAAQP